MTPRVLLLSLLLGCGSSLSNGADEDEHSATDGDSESDGTAISHDGGSPDDPSTQAIAITLRTLSSPHYLSLDGEIAANATAPVTLDLEDLNGGALAHGDPVTLSRAGRYLAATSGGGTTLVLTDMPAANATFTLLRASGAGEVHTGDRVSLRTANGTNYVSAIDGGGASVLADAPWAREWEMFVLSVAGEDAPPSDALLAKQRVLAYFDEISGRHALAGIENKFGDTPRSHTDEVAGLAQRTPSFWGIDFGFGAGAVDQRDTIVAEAIRQWEAGAVVAFMYHTCVPTRDEYCAWDDIGGAHPVHLTNDEWDQLFTEGTAIHAEWFRRLDILASHFQTLKDAGVAPLFRPFHEVNQCAFWWSCVERENGSKKLWNVTRDYLENVKGLDHIIWVWNIQDFTSLADDVNVYSPGPERFDLATLDVYNTGYTAHNYDTMVRAAGGKPIGIGECQFLPNEALLNAQPLWTHFMLWPDFIREQRNLDVYGSLFASSRVITLDEMPGW